MSARLDLDAQLEEYDREADAAIDEVITHLQDMRGVVKQRGRLRMQLAEVLDEYEVDRSWHLPHAELLMMWLDEAADQVVYGVMMRRLRRLGLADALTPPRAERES